MTDEQRGVPTGTCAFPGCENVARDGRAYCFDCRRALERDCRYPGCDEIVRDGREICSFHRARGDFDP